MSFSDQVSHPLLFHQFFLLFVVRPLSINDFQVLDAVHQERSFIVTFPQCNGFLELFLNLDKNMITRKCTVQCFHSLLKFHLFLNMQSRFFPQMAITLSPKALHVSQSTGDQENQEAGGELKGTLCLIILITQCHAIAYRTSHINTYSHVTPA